MNNDPTSSNRDPPPNPQAPPREPRPDPEAAGPSLAPDGADSEAVGVAEPRAVPTSPHQTGSFRPGEIDEIPTNPGVYMMFDAKGKVIYVGKAANLRARVRQYFAKSSSDDRVTIPFLLRSLDHVETILTTNEKEAFLLENTLIKRHRPRYNVRLRDDKTYVSVRIDPAEEWPRAIVTRVRKRDKALYFGPYVSAQAIRQTVRFLQKVFPLRTCTDMVFRNRSRPCLLYQIGMCNGACAGLVNREEYDENLRATIAFLRGRTAEVADVLCKRMRECSEGMQYEKAAVLRDQLAALEQSMEKQRVASHETENRDVVGYHEDQGQAAVVLLFFRNGQLVETSRWALPVYDESDRAALSQFLGQYYGEGRFIPPEVLLPFEPDDADVIQEWLSDLRGGRVHLAVPQRGEKLNVVKMAETNAREMLARKLSGKEEAREVLSDLARRLRLAEPPRSIECYDVATLQGAQSVGAQVSFVEGEPDKSGYRLYRIKGVAGQDDFAMIREVLTRRFRGALETNQDLPDLVLLDGGKGQLGAAQEALNELGLPDLHLAALAKSHLKPAPIADSSLITHHSSLPHHSSPHPSLPRTPEHLFLPGRKNPIVFPPHAPSFYLLQRLRDEAHRFVNTFHVKRRGKAAFHSVLSDVEGIGPRRTRALLRHFGSLTRVREASLEELAAAPAMNAAAARRIHAFFHAPPTQGDLTVRAEDKG